MSNHTGHNKPHGGRGKKLDRNDHTRSDGAWCLSAKDSKVKIFVIPTDEEFMIASDVERIVNGK